MMSDHWREFRVRGELQYHAVYVILEIHHGGQFVKVGGGRFEYSGGEVHWVENIHPDEFSWTDLNSFAWRLGYRKPPVHYWFKHHAKPKFLPIRIDKEAVGMLSDLPKARKIEVYFVGGGDRDVEVCEKEDQMKDFSDVVPHLEFIPEIIMAPLKAANVMNDKGKRKEIEMEISEDEEGYGDDDDDDGIANEEVDEKFIDSDYELNPEDDGEALATVAADDVEFDANVDNINEIEEWTDMGFDGEISDDSEDSAELVSASEESEDEDNDGSISNKRKKIKGKHWVPERDLKNPQFELYQHFDNRDQFKEAVRRYAVLNQANLHFQKNNKTQVIAVCGKKQKGKRSERKCPFWLLASAAGDDSPVFVVRTCDLRHNNCAMVPRVNMCTTTFLAKSYQKRWKTDPNMSRKNFQDTVQDDLKQNISVKQVWRTRQKALKLNEGSEAQQYNLLQTYALVLQETNPNTTVVLKTEMEGDIRKFQRMYVCFDACKRGWLEGCRPLIGLDGCHIKGQYTGQILSAVGIDANNGMFPIAFAIVELESYDSWFWFIELLMVDLNMQSGDAYVFMSDKQKGLLDAVKNLLPDAEHRHCVRHLYNNFKKKNPGPTLKNMVWAAARDTTESWFNRHYEQIKAESLNAWKWFEKYEKPCQWTRSAFRTETKCDLLLNNLCESYNASLIEARDKPILTMMESMRVGTMTRLANRRCAGHKWKGQVGPRIQKILNKNAMRSYAYRANRSSDFVFEVNGTSGTIFESQHSVDLATMTCTCRRWALSGIPCPHAIACIFVKGHDPAEYVHPYYSKQFYLQAYAYPINPVPGIDLWKLVDHPIQPPPFRRMPGRPKKVRTKEAGEAIPASKGKETTTTTNPTIPTSNKLPRSVYVGGKCSECRNPKHNMRTCPVRKEKNAAQGNISVNVSNQGNNTVNVTVQNRGNNDVSINVKSKQVAAAKKQVRRNRSKVGEASGSKIMASESATSNSMHTSSQPSIPKTIFQLNQSSSSQPISSSLKSRVSYIKDGTN